jgi:ribonuclease HI
MPQKFSYYAVRIGRSTGVFTNWGAVLDATEEFDGAEWKGFHNKADAEFWLSGKAVLSAAREYDRLIEAGLNGDPMAFQKAAKLIGGNGAKRVKKFSR